MAPMILIMSKLPLSSPRISNLPVVWSQREGKLGEQTVYTRLPLDLRRRPQQTDRKLDRCNARVLHFALRSRREDDGLISRTTMVGPRSRQKECRLRLGHESASWNPVHR
jgi:hypothetical protein